MEIIKKNRFNNSEIVDGKNMSLDEFRNTYGPELQLEKHVNKATGEQFQSLCFYSKTGARTFVAFSSYLPKMSAADIAREHANLQVIQMTSGSNILCRKGEKSEGEVINW